MATNTYDDLLNALFNPYASEIMQAYGYTPSAGTPSITDPGTYVDTGGTGPGAYIPPSGTPGAIFSGPGTVSGGTVGGGTVGGGTVGGGTVGGGTVGGGTVGGGTVGGGTVGGGTVGGGTAYSGPLNKSPEYLAMIEADIQNKYGGDRFLHSKRNLVGGEQLGSRQTYSLEEFTSGILPYAKGMYGSGVSYDPKTGLMYNNITQEELARRRKADKYARIFGVHPDALTQRERDLIKLGGMGETSPGTKYIRIGGPTSGTHYFIEGDQVYAYDYRAGDTLGFGGMGSKYGENNFQLTPVEFDQWIPSLKPSAKSAERKTEDEEMKAEEVGPSLASEMLIQEKTATPAAPDLTVPDESRTTAPLPPAASTQRIKPGAFGNLSASEILGPIGGLPDLSGLQNLQLPSAPPPPPSGMTRGMVPSLPMPSVGARPSLMASRQAQVLAPAMTEPTAPALPSVERTPEEVDAVSRAAADIRRGGIRFNQGGPVTSGIGGLFRKEVMR